MAGRRDNINPEVLTLFIEAVCKWKKILQMDDWAIYIGLVADNSLRWASTIADAESKQAKIDINANLDAWGDTKRIRKKSLDRTALHELIHCLLSGMRTYYEEFISERNLNFADLTEAQMKAYAIHEEYATEHFVRIFTHRGGKRNWGSEDRPSKIKRGSRKKD